MTLGVVALGLSVASGLLALAPLSDGVSAWLWRTIPALREPGGDWAVIAAAGPIMLALLALVFAAAARVHARTMGWVRWAVRASFLVGTVSAAAWSGTAFSALLA